MEKKRFEEIRQHYADATNDADELAEAALEELKEGSKGDDDAAAVAHGVESRGHRLGAAERFEGHVDTHAAGQLTDRGGRVAIESVDALGGAEAPRRG